jgi:hypothetical protein
MAAAWESECQSRENLEADSELRKVEADSWGRGQFENPEEFGSRYQSTVNEGRDQRTLVCVCVCYSDLWSVVTPSSDNSKHLYITKSFPIVNVRSKNSSLHFESNESKYQNLHTISFAVPSFPRDPTALYNCADTFQRRAVYLYIIYHSLI